LLNGITDEITVDAEGKESINKNGLAVIIGISRSLLTRSDFPKKLAEMLAGRGFDRDHFFNTEFVPDIAAACIIEKYKCYITTE
jgi:hypothetical protein